MFGVNFADGRIKGCPIGTVSPATPPPGGRAGQPGQGPIGGEKTYFVRHVRGNPDYGQNDFIDNASGPVSDLATGLMWARDDSGFGMNWEDAPAYVEQLNDEQYLRYTDWRLPNA